MGSPLSLGAVQAAVRPVAVAARVGAATAPGLAFTVALTESDQGPPPRALAARTCTSYSVPFASSAMVSVVAVESASSAMVAL